MDHDLSEAQLLVPARQGHEGVQGLQRVVAVGSEPGEQYFVEFGYIPADSGAWVVRFVRLIADSLN